jgi:glycosyltransferase involved in cell wall biosynthesis
MPAVSISIPAYNEADIINQTIENVLNQTFEDFELLIIDDGSTDNTAAVVSKYTDDPRVKYIYQENRGFPGARNTGLDEGDGDYYAFIGADDLWEPRKLERQVTLVEDTEIDMVHSNVHHINENNEITGIRWDERPPSTENRKTFVRELFMRNFICIQSVLITRDEIVDRRFDETLGINCDHDMWLRTASTADVAYIDDTLTYKRYDGQNISSDYERLFNERKRLVKKATNYYSYLTDLRSKKLASIHLTYGLNLIADGEIKNGRQALRRAILYDTTSWKSYAAYALSFGGPEAVGAVTEEV